MLIVNIIAVIALLVAYGSVYIPPDKWWIPSFFGLGFIYIAGVNVFFIFLWLLLKPRFLVLPLVFVLAGWGYISRFVQFKGRETEKAGVKVISYNVKFFVGNGNRSSKTIADGIMRFLQEENPDLVCLQEVRLKTNSVFNLEEIRTKYSFAAHYQYARSSNTYGSVTLTRFPIISMGEIRFQGTRNIAIYTDIVANKDTLRIFNVHLQSYYIDPDKYSVIDSPRFSEEDEKEMKEMGSKFIKAFKLRARQSRVIREYIRKSPYPVIVCGDFNDTPVSYSYRKMRGSLNDSFVESGRGLASTYIRKMMSFRIDYILHDSEFGSYNYSQHHYEFSDHLPISCILIKN